MCCGGVGQGAALSVIPDFSLLLIFHCLPWLLRVLPPLLSLDLPGLCRVGPGIHAAPAKTNHQATSLARKNVMTSKVSKPNSRNPGQAWLGERARRIVPSSTELLLPRSHGSSEGVTALDKSSEQEYNHQSQGVSPGKALGWEQFVGGFQGSPVPAESLSDSGSPSVGLSLLYGFDSQHGKH